MEQLEEEKMEYMLQHEYRHIRLQDSEDNTSVWKKLAVNPPEMKTPGFRRAFSSHYIFSRGNSIFTDSHHLQSGIHCRALQILFHKIHLVHDILEFLLEVDVPPVICSNSSVGRASIKSSVRFSFSCAFSRAASI